MSIQKKTEEAVYFLQAGLQKAKEHHDENSRLSSKFGDFETELESISDVFRDIKRWEKMIVDHFSALEQELYNDIFMNPEMEAVLVDKQDLMTTGIKDLRELIQVKGVGKSIEPKDLPTDDDFYDQQTAVCREWVDLGVENKILESRAMLSFLERFQFLGGSKKAMMCSLCLSVFPKNSIIEKKPLIYWWMGEGLVMKSPYKTAEEASELVFQELLDEGFIRPSSGNKSLSLKSFVIDPWIHRMLILIAKKNLFAEFSPQWTPCNGKRRAFLCKDNDAASHSMRISGEREAKDHVMMVFNVDEQYLRMKQEWLSKLKKVEVLQMGRWQNSVAHHIEVEDQTLLNALGSQKHLKYLSLRGISGIRTLPNSISNLTSLHILDLRACYDLERLPPTISALTKLTHLDVSHCHLLESIPMGVEQLAALQVFKGFVIGKDEKNSSKISDLAQLMNLRKLSIRVRKDHQLGSLQTLPALRILTISWVKFSALGKAVSLPKKLTKLDLRCVPFESVPDWLSPNKLPSDLAKLYIKGGRLKSLENRDGHVWKVSFLRFKYLDDLNNYEQELLVDYKYLDKFDCYELRSDIKSTTDHSCISEEGQNHLNQLDCLQNS